MPSVMRQARRLGRAGFTMVEIMVAMVLLSLVVAGLLAVVMEQERFYDGAQEVMEVRDNLRRIGDLLPAELRGMSPVEGDLFAMTDSAVEFRAPTGVSVLCVISPARTVITLPPAALASDAGLTSWITAPVIGDTIFVLDPRDSLADVFVSRRVTAAPGVGTCPTTTGLTTNTSEAAQGVTLTLDAALPATIPPGAPVRFARRVRYALYQSATDNLWYLGYSDFVPNRVPAWSARQPVAGPLLPYASSGATGFQLVYRDSAGTALTNLADAARVRQLEIVARARSRVPMRTAGARRSAGGYYVDSLRTAVALRNY